MAGPDQTIAEIVNSEADSLVSAIRAEIRAHWTMLRVAVAEPSDGHTATLQPSTKATIRQPDGTFQTQELPQLSMAPVHFAGGGGVTATHPVTTGDEGAALIASHNMDGWWQQSGVQDPVDARAHSLSDPVFIPGGRSDPRKLSPPPSTSSHQTRSDDGNHVNDVHPANGLTNASTTKHTTIVGGTGGSATQTTPTSIIKNSPKLMMNTVTAPGLPPPGVTLANGQMVATTPIPAIGPGATAIASAMASVLTGGPSAIFADPTAAANTALAAGASSGAGSLTAALGGAAATMVAALTGAGGLADALAALGTGTAMLSGAVAPTGGAYGLADVMGHAAALAQYFGSSPPSAVSLSTVLGPLQCGPTLGGMTSSLGALVASVIAGSTTVSAGTAAVAAMSASVNALMPAANGAIGTLQAAGPALALVSSAAAAINSQTPQVAAAAAAVSTGGLAAVAAAMAAFTAPSSADLAAATSFPDASATQPGARGGL